MRQPSRLHLAVLLAPAIAVLAGLFAGGLALAAAQSLGYFPPLGAPGFTLAHYRALLADREFWASVRLTLGVASAATILSSAIGLALALSLRELAARSRKVALLLQIPLAIPHLAMAVTVIHLIAPSGWIARVGFALGLVSEPAAFPALINDRYGIGILLTYVLKEAPFITLMTLVALLRVGDEFEQVARTLGASSWQRFRHVTLPMAAPATVSAALLVFAYILGAVEVPFLLGRPFPALLPVVAQRRYQSLDLNDRPEAVALAVLLALFTALLVWLYARLARRLVGIEQPVIF